VLDRVAGIALEARRATRGTIDHCLVATIPPTVVARVIGAFTRDLAVELPGVHVGFVEIPTPQQPEALVSGHAIGAELCADVALHLLPERPHLVDEPAAGGCQRGHADAAVGADRDRDEAAPLQRAQVTGQGRPVHRQAPGQVRQRERPLLEQSREHRELGRADAGGL